jgi:hypothetical protein
MFINKDLIFFNRRNALCATWLLRNLIEKSHHVNQDQVVFYYIRLNCT